MDDLILISVDDHMVEPPDMFDNHIPAKYGVLDDEVRSAATSPSYCRPLSVS